jgi:hypothetical protein
MKKFIFNNITIYEAWEQFIHDIGQEYELQGGSIVIIEEVGPLVKETFSVLKFNDNEDIPDYQKNGELNWNKYTGESSPMFGFFVKVKTHPDKKGITAHNTEFIHVLYESRDEKCIVETNSKNTLIHNK